MLITKRRNSCMGILACLVVALVASQADAQTKLRWKFRKGDQLVYVMQQKMNMKMTVMGNDVENKITQTLDFIWTVRDVDEEGVAQILQKIERIQFSMEAPAIELKYDSKDGQFPEGQFGKSLGPVFEAMVGAEMEMTMNALGEVLDVKLPEKLVEEFEQNPLMAQVGFSEESLKQMSSQGSVSFPEDAITKGKTWEKITELKMPFGVAETANKFTYKGPATKGGGHVEQIGLEVSMSIKPAPGSLFEIEVKSMESDGILDFDNQLGRLLETNLNQNMVMEISTMGQVIQQAIDQTVSMKLMANEDG